MSLPFSFISGLATKYIQHGLMIAGGALVGAVVTGVILVVLFKLARVKKTPRRLTTVLSVMGGIVGGDLSGKGSTLVSTARDTRREADYSLRVMIVRSRDYEPESKRYYLVEGRTPARTLPEVIQVIKDRHQLNPALKTVEIVIYQDSIAETRGLADDVEDPVRPLGLTVKTHKPGTDAP